MKFMKKITSLLCLFLLLGTAFADTQSAIFNRTVKHLDQGGLHFQFQNMENLDKQFHFLLDFAGKANINDPMQQMVFKNVLSVLNVLNFKDIQAIGSSTVRLQKNLYANKLFVAISPNASGAICALPAQTNVNFQFAANLPANTLLAMGAYLDWNNFVKTFEKVQETREMIQSAAMMFEQSLGLKLQDAAADISGEFFGALYRGKKKDELHFAIAVPDKNELIKNLAVKNLGTMLRRYNDGSFSFEMPTAASSFGSGITIYFSQKRVYIYNSNAPLNELFNTNGKMRKLSAVNPQIFGILNNINGNSYMVCNINPKDFNSKLTSHNYQYASVSKFFTDGCLVDAKSSFNLQDVSEYSPILEMLPELQEMLNDDDDNPPLTNQPAMSL